MGKGKESLKQTTNIYLLFEFMKKKKNVFHLSAIVLTVLLAIITISAAFSTKVSPVNSSYFPSVGLILPGLLIANFIILLFWGIKLRYWALLPLIAILGNWNYIGSMYQLPFKSKQTGNHSSVKIATFNVGGFGKDNSGYAQRRVAIFMAQENVDIICMQEFSEIGSYTADSLLTLYSSWPYVIIPEPEENNPILPMAVYSRYPVLDYQLITYEGTPNCSMWLDIAIKGRTIRVFTNHLQTTNINQSLRQYEKYYKNTNSINADMQFVSGAKDLYHSNEIRRSIQAEKINRMVKESPYPVIVCGDFNSTPASYVYETMKGNLKDGFRTAGHGYASTFRYFKGLLRVDYIFHSPSIQVIDYYSSKIDLGSDHNPVIMEFE